MAAMGGREPQIVLRLEHGFGQMISHTEGKEIQDIVV